MKNKSRRNESLCEKSMKMVTNMVKMSSLSISRVSLGISAPTPATKSLVQAREFVMVVNKAPQFTGNKRSQDQQSSTKPMAYLIQPAVSGNDSRSLIREDDNVDGKASEFIKKVRKRMDCASNEMTDYPAYTRPPAMRVVK